MIFFSLDYTTTNFNCSNQIKIGGLRDVLNVNLIKEEKNSLIYSTNFDGFIQKSTNKGLN